jgi:hypothetical protein
MLFSQHPLHLTRAARCNRFSQSPSDVITMATLATVARIPGSIGRIGTCPVRSSINHPFSVFNTKNEKRWNNCSGDMFQSSLTPGSLGLSSKARNLACGAHEIPESRLLDSPDAAVMHAPVTTITSFAIRVRTCCSIKMMIAK